MLFITGRVSEREKEKTTHLEIYWFLFRLDCGSKVWGRKEIVCYWRKAFQGSFKACAALKQQNLFLFNCSSSIYF